MNTLTQPAGSPLTMTIRMTGEHFEYLTSSRRGDGVFRFRWTLAPGKKGPPEHYHLDETETFEVESGALHIWLGKEHHLLKPGDSLSVPPKVRHRFLNDGKEPAVVRVSYDGSRNEEAHVPVAAYFSGGAKMGFRAFLRMLVHDTEVGGSLAAWEPLNKLQRALAWVTRLFGVKRFPSVDW